MGSAAGYLHLRRGALLLTALAVMLAALTASAGIAQAGHGPAHPPVDVVFIIDESGSMGPDIADVKANVGLIASTLGATLDPAFALVGFGARSSSAHSLTSGDPHTHTDFTNQAGFSTALNELIASGGREPGIDATIHAMNSVTGYRSGAGVCVVLITDEPTNGDNNTLAAANAALDAKGAVWFGIKHPTAGNAAYGPNVGSMSEHTGGAVWSINDFRNNPTPVLNALLNACVIAVTQNITLSPEHDVNPAGTDHSVTATVVDSAGDPVVGTDVTFTVISGPNVGDSGVVPTDASGQAIWTYTGDGGIGTDEITASFVDNDGATKTSRVVTKEWTDSTPPEVGCLETNNPSGKNVPKAGKDAGKSGQNPDGFYIVGATDSESGVASIVLKDDASAWTFALNNGDKIKLTQAPGVEPNAKPGSGDIDWKIQIKGDATITATDLAGNSASTKCLVPQPPK